MTPTSFASVSTKASADCLREDTCRTFDSLCEEKKHLIHTVDRQRKLANADRKQQQLQIRHQMNSLNKQQHAALERMSAFDRYKRKKRNSTAEHITTTHQHATNSSPPTQQPTATNVTRIDKQSPDIIGFTPIQTLDDVLKFADILRNECTETQMQHVTELEQDETDLWSTTICEQFKHSLSQIRKKAMQDKEWNEDDEQAPLPRESEKKKDQELREKERREAEDQTRLQREQRENKQREAEEQARLRLEQGRILQEQFRQAQEQLRLVRERAEREIEERRHKKPTRIQLQCAKNQADLQFQVAWLLKRSLVRQRRANQSANAG